MNNEPKVELSYGVEAGFTAAEKSFSDNYFAIHKALHEKGKIVPSRNGNTKEFLNFTTHIAHPNLRCVGGHKRNINIFFLLAEAMWIWCGRRDVAFLDVFNSQLKTYSDDGLVYHAPYGFRLRNFGVHSNAKDLPYQDEEDANMTTQNDQIATILEMLHTTPSTRQAVAQIWNAELDLNATSKDIPCNDMVMFKIRDGKLHATIQNRSNDLTLGLPTNLFQFSFITELMANILNIGIGTQTHNSQSLHLYLESNANTNSTMTDAMYDSIIATPDELNLYNICKSLPLHTRLDGVGVKERLGEVDFMMKSMVTLLNKANIQAGHLEYADRMFVDNQVYEFSRMFHHIFCLLHLYIQYKHKKIKRLDALRKLSEDGLLCGVDISMLAMNFFMRRIKDGNDETEKQLADNLIAANQYLTPLQKDAIGQL